MSSFFVARKGRSIANNSSKFAVTVNPHSGDLAGSLSELHGEYANMGQTLSINTQLYGAPMFGVSPTKETGLETVASDL